MKNLTTNPFFFYIKKFKKHFALGSAALIITDVADILSPYIMGKLLNQFQEQGNLQNTTTLFAILVAASVTTAVFRYAWRIYFARFHHGAALDLRLRLYKSFFKKDLLSFSKQSTGDKMSLFTKDIENFRMGLGPGLLILVDAILYLILIPFTMWQLSPQWTLILLVIAPIIPIVIALMEKNLNLLFDDQQKELSQLSAIAQESLEGIKVIKSFRMEKFRSHLYEKENKKLFNTSTKLDFLHSSFSPVLEFFVSISCAGLLFSVAFYSDLATLKIGTLFAFYQYMQRMTWPLTALGLGYMMVKEAQSSFKRIKVVLEDEPNKIEKKLPQDSSRNPIEPTNFGLKKVNFKYPEAEALKADEHSKPLDDHSYFFKNLNLQLNSNESYLITGRTKSGKTSLLNLLNGLMLPESGTITTPLKFISNPQVPFLFMETVDRNISINNTKPSLEDLKSVSFEGEYDHLSQKGDTLVGEKGTSLSGGQKQRLSLLRAFKSSSSLLFLDEPLSAVDEITKKELVKSLKEETKKGKSFVIATSNPEHYTWIDNVILISEDTKTETRSIEVLKMAEALTHPRFQNLLRKPVQNKGG